MVRPRVRVHIWILWSNIAAFKVDTLVGHGCDLLLVANRSGRSVLRIAFHELVFARIYDSDVALACPECGFGGTVEKRLRIGMWRNACVGNVVMVI